MENWHDVRNQSSDKSSGSEHKVFSLTGGGGPGGDGLMTIKCSVCGKTDHQRNECPLKKSGAVIHCTHHPHLKNSHTTQACRNPSSSSSGETGGTRGSGQDRGTRGRGRGKRGRGRGRGRSRSKEGNVNIVQTEEAQETMSVQVEEFHTSPISRAVSPTDRDYSSLEEEEPDYHTEADIFSLSMETSDNPYNSSDDDTRICGADTMTAPKQMISFISEIKLVFNYPQNASPPSPLSRPSPKSQLYSPELWDQYPASRSPSRASSRCTASRTPHSRTSTGRTSSRAQVRKATLTNSPDSSKKVREVREDKPSPT